MSSINDSQTVTQKKVNVTATILSSVLGNCLEVYDMMLFIFFRPVIAETFFPGDNGRFFVDLLIAIGFAARPCGAVFFGHLGDKIGRKPALLSALILMGVATFMVGIIPSYVTIGVFGPIFLMLARFLQLFSVGGEQCGSAVFVLESIKNKIGLARASAILSVSFLLGLIFAACVRLFMQANELMAYWRWAFILGAAVAVIGSVMRVLLVETGDFEKLKKEAKTVTLPLKEVLLSKSLVPLLFGIGITGVDSTIVYFSSTMDYLLHSPTISSKCPFIYGIMASIGGICMPILLKIGFKRLFYILSFNTLLLIIFLHFVIGTFVPLGFIWSLYTVHAILSFCVGTLYALKYMSNFLLFKTATRYTGMSFAMSLGIMIGGCTPFMYNISENLTGNALWGLWWPILVIGLFLILLGYSHYTKKLDYVFNASLK